MKLIKNSIIIVLISLSTILTAQEAKFSNLLQNIDSREKISLNGAWNYSVVPYEIDLELKVL